MRKYRFIYFMNLCAYAWTKCIYLNFDFIQILFANVSNINYQSYGIPKWNKVQS